MTTTGLPSSFCCVRFDTIGSTSDEARRLAEIGAEPGTIVWALEQSSGRGRQGRTWSSPRGNLYCSVILRPDCSTARATELSFVAAVALADALAGLLPSDADIRLKWPNDVLVGGAKIAGLLLESASRTGELDYLVLGIGVNIVSSPEQVRYPATSLAAQGAVTDAENLLAKIFIQFDRWYARWQAEGLAPVREAWLARAFQLGETIELSCGTQTISGRFADLGAGGSLVLEQGGALTHITAGEWTVPLVGG